MLARQQAFDLGGPADHFRLLHGGHRHSVAVCTKSQAGEFQQKLYPHRDAAAMAANLAAFDDLSTYLSQSGFASKGGRTVANLRALTSLWVDLDYYKLPELRTLAPEALLDLALDRVRWLPVPTLLVESGRGAYFVWALDRAVSPERLPEWQRVQDTLVAALADLGADPAARDAARILRVVGSFHTGVGERVTARQVGDRVSLDTMLHLVAANAPAAVPGRRRAAPELRVIPGAGQQPAAKRRHAGSKGLNDYRLAFDRMGDYRRLAELRTGSGKLSEGRRRLAYCFAQAAAWFCGDARQLRAEIDDFAQGVCGLPANEAANVTGSVVARFMDDGGGRVRRLQPAEGEGRYRFTNAYVIRLLGITDDEQRELRTIISPAERERRRVAKRRAAGIESRDDYLNRAEQRRVEACWLRAQGVPVAEIAERLGIARSHVYRLLAG